MAERARFHRSLYPLTAVQAAAARFAAFGPQIEETEVDLLVTFATVPPHLADRVADEFANHALFETIVAARC